MLFIIWGSQLRSEKNLKGQLFDESYLHDWSGKEWRKKVNWFLQHVILMTGRPDIYTIHLLFNHNDRRKIIDWLALVIINVNWNDNLLIILKIAKKSK